MVKSPEEIAEEKENAKKKAEEKLRGKLTKRFHKACAEYGLIEDGDHILIGLSGGKDSLLLTELLGKRARIYKPHFTVSALHVRVKERDYTSDLTYLEEFCKEAGIPLMVRDVSIDNSQFTMHNSQLKIHNEQLGRQKKVREINNPCFLCSWYRRKELFNVAQELGCNKIAFGHHRDDLLETMLMNLIYQGAFATMPPKLQMEKMPLQIIRPLCLIDEADIKEYAAMREYKKQVSLCPFEHVSSREKVKGLLAEIKTLNPEAADTMFGAMGNVKEEYLIRPLQLP